jgi:hypothetical protein
MLNQILIYKMLFKNIKKIKIFILISDFYILFRNIDYLSNNNLF